MSVCDFPKDLTVSNCDTLLDTLPLGVAVFDASQRLIMANTPYAVIYRIKSPDDWMGHKYGELVDEMVRNGTIDATVATGLSLASKASPDAWTELVLYLSDGRSALVRTKPLQDGGWISIHEDISDRIQAENNILHFATHDSLTDLPNRKQLQERLDLSLARVRRGEKIGLLWVDLDRFKNVNDTLGHQVGDKLLVEVADRIRTSVRETDVPARLGGDEFAVLQVPIKDIKDTEVVAERLLKRLSMPFVIENATIHIGATIGIVVADETNCDVTKLLSNADFALYRAKSEGRGIYRHFDPAMNAEMLQRKTMERQLRRAIIRDELRLHYQPVVDLRDGSLKGFEALVRWHHPDGHMVSPSDFIPIAEECGLINLIGDWVLAQACSDAAKWTEPLQVSVNVSPCQFKCRTAVKSVINALNVYHLPASRLQLEITETVLLSDDPEIDADLMELRDLGITIAVDDFGTGYSSLSTLRRGLFDVMKIDRSFVADTCKNSTSDAILATLIELGQALGLEVVAEGIETDEQRQLLLEKQCRLGQGYYFSRPLPLDEANKLFDASKRDPEPSAIRAIQPII